MIPHMSIVAWSNEAPWASLQQVEQDLLISRAVIEIFRDDDLREEFRFRGGTALHKLHFPKPLRYSEDIDLVRTTEGPIGPVLDRLRDVLDWLGQAQMADLFGWDQSVVSRHIRTAFKEGELERASTMQKMHIAVSDKPVEFYRRGKGRLPPRRP